MTSTLSSKGKVDPLLVWVVTCNGLAMCNVLEASVAAEPLNHLLFQAAVLFEPVRTVWKCNSA